MVHTLWELISKLFRCSVVSNSLQPNGLQHARLHVLHYLPEFAQTHVHWVSDAIQPAHPLLPPAPPAFNHSPHQGFFPISQLLVSGGQSIGASISASVLPVKRSLQTFHPLGTASRFGLWFYSSATILGKLRCKSVSDTFNQLLQGSEEVISVCEHISSRA